MSAPDRSASLRYGYGVLAVAIALGAALASRAFDLEGFLFVIAVAVAVWFGGRGPGVVALVLSIFVLNYFFLSSPEGWEILPSHITYFVVFSVLAVVISLFSEARHRAESALLRTRDDLERKVLERTVELERSNALLRDEITERRRAEAELRRSEAFLAEGQRISHTGSWSWTVADGRLGWSDELFRLLGLEPGSVEPSLELSYATMHPQDRDLVRTAFEHALRTGSDYAVRCRFVLPDGTVRHVESIARPTRDEAGTVTEMIGTTMDVTQRRHAEAEIRKQAELLELAHDAIIVRDRQGRVTFWSRGAEETYGWPAASAIGKPIDELLRTTSGIPLGTALALTHEQGRWEGELTHTRRDGRVIVVTSRWSLQRDEHGRPTAILEINRDVSDRKEAEEALRRAESELAHVSRVTTLGEVTASFAHEVNQPLAAIANNANASLGLLPRDRPDLEEVREALADIVRDAVRASAIIERVRALARRSTAERAPLRLEDVVADVVALAAADAAARGVVIRCAIATPLPPVHGDRVQLQQVLLNLVVNGMDAMAGTTAGARLLVIEGHAGERDGAAGATIAVHDHGVGLDGTDRTRLFEAFYSTKPQGMGMGLAISRSIIESHAGRLWAAPGQDGGAVFAFTLPACAMTEGSLV